MAPAKPIELDGRTGEGGGQLVRIAVALASVCSQPVRITNVRGNRPGARGGGLKSQHVTSIAWLAEATDAEVSGLEVGSTTLSFHPRRGPARDHLCGWRDNNSNNNSNNSNNNNNKDNSIEIRAESPAASALLIFQAVFPFLLFAAPAPRGPGADDVDDGRPVELTISGGTNVSFSPSWEYLDQVLLPTLERWFGGGERCKWRVERRLVARGWSSGGRGGALSRGELWFRVQPLPRGSTLELREEGLLPELGAAPGDFDVVSVDVTIITPADMHGCLEDALRDDLEEIFPRARLDFREPEESGHESRIYVLLVAKTKTLRWGRDVLYGGRRKGKSKTKLSQEVSQMVTKALQDEVLQGGVVDEFLQDQLVIFQALARGKTSFPRHTRQTERNERSAQPDDAFEAEPENLRIGEELREDRVRGPLGDPDTDSNHTRTARWVASEMLEPKIKWYSKGRVCKGMGLVSGGSGPSS